MRVLWHSNASHVSSGYGVQTMLVTPRLQAEGHEVAVAALWGLEGGMMAYPGPREPIACYPKGHSQASMDVLPAHARHFNADVVLTHYDAWTINVDKLGVPWVPWFPVDTDKLANIVHESVAKAAVRITQTRHGVQAVQDRGLDCEYVPAGFHGDAYKPVDAEGILGPIAEDRFVVGCIAANRGSRPSRKAFPQIFEGFKLFYDKHPEALLYLQTRLDTVEGGVDVRMMLEHFGIPERAVLTVDQYSLLMGLTPDLMARVYASLDVLLCPSMGEGFGVPIVEAQACGTPVITGGWTSMPELTRSGYAIPKEDAFRYFQDGYGDWFLPQPRAIADALEESMAWDYPVESVSAQVQEFEIERVFDEHWLPAVAKIEAAIAPPVLNRAERRRMKVSKPAKGKSVPKTVRKSPKVEAAVDPLLAAIEAS